MRQFIVSTLAITLTIGAAAAAFAQPPGVKTAHGALADSGGKGALHF